MASSNNLKNQILALFPDNNNKEISAADMRVFVNAVFDNKEEIVVKIPGAADIKLNKDRIFEKTIVILESSDKGIWLSRVNNPISISQLTLIASLDGTPIFTGGNLNSDGSVPMDDGYVPSLPLDIATKEYADSLASGNPYPIGTVENFLYTFNYIKVSNEAEFIYDIDGNIESVIVTDGNISLYTISFVYYMGNVISRLITDSVGNYCTTTFNYINGDIVSKQNVLVSL